MGLGEPSFHLAESTLQLGEPLLQSIHTCTESSR
jgi:hypothetical protein